MRNIFIISILLMHTALSAQKSTESADAYYDNFKFKQAIESYSKIASKSKRPSQYLIQRLADSYYNINDYQNAQLWYERLYSAKGHTIGESTFIRYIQSLKAAKDYEMANNLLREYYKDDYARLKLIAAEKKHLDSISKEESLYEIFDLEINSSKSDFGAVYYDNNHVVFSSTRDTTRFNDKIYAWNDQPYLDIYIAERNRSNGELDNPKKFLKNLESAYHDATLTFPKDFKTVYFTRNYLRNNNNKLKVNKEGVSNMQILKGNIEGGRITNAVPLNFNSPSYSCAHPTLSPDGKYLFFVSDMPGGYGETDIYVVDVFKDGTVDKPVNLGPTINTPGREMFPNMVENTLYFASDAHYGLGGLDIFKAQMKGKKNYSIPSNLGAPVNSNMDDFAYVFDPEESTGYFSSNRSDGKGDDDIYFFRKKKPTMFHIHSGRVLDAKTKEPIPGASVKVYDVFNKLETEITSDNKGFYSVKLPCCKENALAFSKRGYNRKSLELNYVDQPCPVSVEEDVYLVRFESLVEKEGNVEKIKVDPIYFDFDKYDITPQAIKELEKVVYAMEEFPSLKIRIESHTDSRGDDGYNLRLSEARAKSTQNYLIYRGIDPQRIESAKGFGESRLKNGCFNGISCSEEEHLINRRSDFIIIEK